MDINTLYHYVFGDLARDRTEERIRARFPHENPDQNIIDEIHRQQNKIRHQQRKKFASITRNKAFTGPFRHMLREVGSKDLESLLYGNHRDILTQDGLTPSFFPSNESALDSFQHLNTQYRWFKEGDKKTNAVFLEIFKGCKLMLVCMENHHHRDNQRSYLLAYKILVLFDLHSQNPLALVSQFVKRFQSQKRAVLGYLDNELQDLSTPIQFSGFFKNELPVFDNHIQLKQWRAFIKRSGYPALVLFSEAKAIQSGLKGRMPENLNEAHLAKALIRFKRAGERPELAQLCVKYHVSENIFNQCLDIKPKLSDKLPDIIINGEDIGRVGYHWVKLPGDDPRAYLLGKIVNCCQSIGGQSHQCVVDGVQLETHGFYVLLKQISKNQHLNPILTDGKINYDQFELVGQGYAWLSMMGNLVIDSWENLTPDRDNPVAVDMLHEFANQVIEKHTDVLSVSLGVEGKSLEHFKQLEKSKHPELSRNFQYGDSFSQVRIVRNDQIKATFQFELDSLGLEGFDVCSAEHLNLIKLFFANESFKTQHQELFKAGMQFLNRCKNNQIFLLACHELYQAQILDVHHYTHLVSMFDEYEKYLCSGVKTNNLVRVLVQCRQLGYLTQSIAEQIFTDTSGNLDNFANALAELGQNRITKSSFQLLLRDRTAAHILSAAMIRLDAANILTEEHCRLLAMNPILAREISDTLIRLAEANLLTHDTNRLLSANSKFFGKMADVIILLDRISLNIEEYHGLLLKHADAINSVALVLDYFRQYDLLHLELINPLLLKANCAFMLILVLNKLSEQGLLNASVIKTLMGSLDDIDDFWSLLSAYPVLLNQDFCKHLFRHMKHCRDLNVSLYQLGNAGLLTMDYLDLLINNMPYSKGLGHLIIRLHAQQLSNDESVALLALHPENAMQKSAVIDHLSHKVQLNFTALKDIICAKNQSELTSIRMTMLKSRLHKSTSTGFFSDSPRSEMPELFNKGRRLSS